MSKSLILFGLFVFLVSLFASIGMKDAPSPVEVEPVSFLYIVLAVVIVGMAYLVWPEEQEATR